MLKRRRERAKPRLHRGGGENERMTDKVKQRGKSREMKRKISREMFSEKKSQRKNKIRDKSVKSSKMDMSEEKRVRITQRAGEKRETMLET